MHERARERFERAKKKEYSKLNVIISRDVNFFDMKFAKKRKKILACDLRLKMLQKKKVKNF